MALTLIPDAEVVVRAGLVASADVTALVGQEVVPQTPDNTDVSWVRITLLDAREAGASMADHLINCLVQFDCYAGVDNEQGDAVLLGRTVRAALNAMVNTAQAGAVVTLVEFVGHSRLPDPDFEPARERIVLSAEIYMHPA